MDSPISDFIKPFRPALWPVAWAHAFTGFVVAKRSGLFEIGPTDFAWGVIASGLWALLIVGPAAALAWAFRRTTPQSAAGLPAEGCAASREPIAWIAIGALLLNLALSPIISWKFFDASRIGLLLIVVAITPPVRLQTRSVIGPLAQAIGLGALTFYAGLSAAGTSLFADLPTIGWMIGFALLFLAVRAYEQHDAIGAGWLFAVGLGGAFLCFGLAAAGTGARWSGALLMVPLVAWALAGAQRFRQSPSPDRPDLATAPGLWILTDAAVALAALQL